MPGAPTNTPSKDNLPCGLDRADGLNGRLGTPTPSGAIQYDSDGGSGLSLIPINELASSPTMERAEQCTVRKSFTGAYAEMLNRWVVYPRGTLVVDSGNNFFRILSTTLSHIQGKGDIGQLDLVMEALSFDTPPDQFSCNTVNLGLDIMKSPRYFYALMPTAQIPPPWPAFISADTPIQSAVKSCIIRAIQAYRENPLVPPQNMYGNISGYFHDLIMSSMVSSNVVFAMPNTNCNFLFSISTPDKTPLVPGSPPAPAASNGQYNPAIYYASFAAGITADPNGKIALATAAAQELMAKLWRMEDAPPVYGIEMTLKIYSWRPPYINLGSYIEDPLHCADFVPDYFTCPSVIPDGSTIFDNIGNLNPQYYSKTGMAGGGTSISWLRCADSIEFDRTFFVRTIKWMGAPVGCWDADLFNQKKRPTIPDDYKSVVLG